eukprot:1137051-Pelagomonas_calceolata.AAC.1
MNLDSHQPYSTITSHPQFQALPACHPLQASVHPSVIRVGMCLTYADAWRDPKQQFMSTLQKILIASAFTLQVISSSEDEDSSNDSVRYRRRSKKKRRKVRKWIPRVGAPLLGVQLKPDCVPLWRLAFIVRIAGLNALFLYIERSFDNATSILQNSGTLT